MKILIFVAAFFAIDMAFATSQECLPAADLAQVQHDFIFKSLMNTKGVTEDLKVDSCNPESQSYKLLDAMIFIKNLPPLKIQKDDFDLGLMEDTPYEFIRKRAKFIYLETEESSQTGTCSSSLTVAFARAGTPNIMHVCPYFAGLSKVTVSGMFVHESRHFDGKKFGHSFCMTGPMMGQLACDPSYEHGGAYGIETEYYVRLFRTTSLPEEIRKKAHSYVLEYFIARFAKLPLGITAGALLVDENAGLSFFDGKENFAIFTPEKPGLVALRTNIPVYFDRATGDVGSYTGNPELIKTEGAFAEVFRDLPSEKRQQVLDVHYGRFACLLYAQSLYCKDHDQIVELPLPQGVTADQFIVLGNLPGEDLVMILAQDGSLYQLPYAGEVKDWKAEQIKISDPLKNYRGVAMLKGMNRIALNMNGEFMKMNDKTTKYEVDPSMSSTRYQKIIAPFFWTPRFNSL